MSEGSSPKPRFDIKGQIKIDVFLRIWDTHYQNRQKKWRKISEQSFLPDCSIFTQTGDLTIASIPLDYEGWYTCKKSGKAEDFTNDGLHYVKVYVNG